MNVQGASEGFRGDPGGFKALSEGVRSMPGSFRAFH